MPYFFTAGNCVTVSRDRAQELFADDEVVSSLREHIGTRSYLHFLTLQAALAKVLTQKDVNRGFYIAAGVKVELTKEVIFTSPFQPGEWISPVKDPSLRGKYIESSRHNSMLAVKDYMEKPFAVEIDLGMGWGRREGLVDLQHFHNGQQTVYFGVGNKVWKAKAFFCQHGYLQFYGYTFGRDAAKNRQLTTRTSFILDGGVSSHEKHCD